MKAKIIHVFKNFKNGSFSAKNKLIYKSVLSSKFLDNSFKAVVYAYSFPNFKKSVFSPKPICIETGRGRGVLSKFFLSRISFKKYSINGQIIGFRKSRWLSIQLLFLYLDLILLFCKDRELFLFRYQKLLRSFCLCFIRKVTFLITNLSLISLVLLFLSTTRLLILN